MDNKDKPAEKSIPTPSQPSETTKRGYQPIGPKGGNGPDVGKAAPSNPPSRGSAGKK